MRKRFDKRIKPMVKCRAVPLESDEQRKLAQYLDSHGYCWFHPPNEIPSVNGRPNYAWITAMRQRGMKKGIPDVLIFGRNDYQSHKPMAIELKRQSGGRPSVEQTAALSALRCYGWITRIAKGADEAISMIEEVYGRK